MPKKYDSKWIILIVQFFYRILLGFLRISIGFLAEKKRMEEEENG